MTCFQGGKARENVSLDFIGRIDMLFFNSFGKYSGSVRAVLAVLAVLLVAGCSKKGTAAVSGKSYLLVTTGGAPMESFEPVPGTNGVPIVITPVLKRLAEAGGMSGHNLPAGADIQTAAAMLLGPDASGKTIAASLAGRGYSVAAFSADPGLVPAALGFDEGGCVSKRPNVDLRFLPLPFAKSPADGFVRGDEVSRAAAEWIATEAGTGLPKPPPPKSGAPAAPKKGAAAEPPPNASLKRPVFVWIHLADPVFADTSARVKAVHTPAGPLGAEVAFMDFQLGRLLDTLAKLGLRDSFEVAVVQLQGGARTAEAFADPAGAGKDDFGMGFSIIPGKPAGSLDRLLGAWMDLPARAAAAPAAPASADEKELLRRRLTFRMLHPRPGDTAALDEAVRLTELEPGNPDAWTWRGVAELEAKKPAEALASHQKAAELDGSPYRVCNVGISYYLTGDAPKAIDQIENAYLAETANPRYVALLASTLQHVGMALFGQGGLNDAQACLSRVLYLQPKNLAAMVSLGRVYGRMGQKDLAKEYFGKALALKPGYKPALAAMRELDKPAEPAKSAGDASGE